MKKAGFDARFIGEWAGTGRQESFLHLVEFSDMVSASDPRFERLQEWDDAAIIRIAPVGGYAEPLSEDERAGTIARRA